MTSAISCIRERMDRWMTLLTKADVMFFEYIYRMLGPTRCGSLVVSRVGFRPRGPKLNPATSFCGNLPFLSLHPEKE